MSAAGFLRDVSGSIAIMAGLSVPVLLLCAGGLIEINGAMNARMEGQKALDAGVIMAARAVVSGDDEDVARGRGESMIRANLSTLDTNALDIDLAFEADGTVNGTLIGKTKSFFTSMIFPQGIGFDAISSVKITALPVDIALVLDVSSSMDDAYGGGTVLSEMKGAATAFIDALEDSGADAQIAIVPFAQTVNVGASNSAFVTGTNHSYFDGENWAGCVFERPGATRHADMYDGSENGDSGKWHAYVWPPEPDVAGQPGAGARFCMNPSDGTNDGYGAHSSGHMAMVRGAHPDIGTGDSPWTYGPNLNCTRHPMTPLTPDLASVRTTLAGLSAPTNLGTIIAPGIAWAQRILSPGEPFTEGGGSRAGARKVLIVLTDGEQRTNGESWVNGGKSCDAYRHSGGSDFYFDPAAFKLDGEVLSGTGPKTMMTPYGYILDSNPLGDGNGTFAREDANTDELTADACEVVKTQGGMEVITIGVTNNTGPGSRIYTLLEECASTPEDFFYVESAAELGTRFEKLARSVTGLSISR